MVLFPRSNGEHRLERPWTPRICILCGYSIRHENARIRWILVLVRALTNRPVAMVVGLIFWILMAVVKLIIAITRVSVSLSLTSRMARTRLKVLFGNACQVLNGAPARHRHSCPKHHLPATETHTTPQKQHNKQQYASIIIIVNIRLRLYNSTSLIRNHSFSTSVSTSFHHYQYVCLPPPSSPNQETLRQGHHSDTG